MAKHSFNSLMRRLSQAGFNRQFVTTALMPDWWEDSYAQDPDILPEFEFRVARFLDIPLSVVRTVEEALLPSPYGVAQLRKVRDIERDRLGPAIHTAIRVSRAVIRNLRYSGDADVPSDIASEWRRLLQPGERGPVSLEILLEDLWARGIPVVPLDMLPAPSFQGMACIVEERPTIVLGHKHDEPGRVAFLVAHEAGHIAAGDCSQDTLVLDEDEGVQDESAMERAADQFASSLLLGEEKDLITDEKMDAKVLAQMAFNLESQTNAEASAIIYAWAARTLDYPTAAMKALYRATGARQLARTMFDQYVDLDSAGESDRSLLRCVYGEPEPTAVAS